MDVTNKLLVLLSSMNPLSINWPQFRTTPSSLKITSLYQAQLVLTLLTLAKKMGRLTANKR